MSPENVLLQGQDPTGFALDEITGHMKIFASLFPELEHLELDHNLPERKESRPYVKALKLRTSGIFAEFKSLRSLHWSDGEMFHRSSGKVVSQGVQLRQPSRYFPLHLDV